MGAAWALDARRIEDACLTFEDLLLAFRCDLLASGFNVSLAALGFAARFHTGPRKDGVSLAMSHQLAVAAKVFEYRKALSVAGVNADHVVAAATLHDTPEENCLHALVRPLALARTFHSDVSRWSWGMSKYQPSGSRNSILLWRKPAPFKLLPVGDYHVRLMKDPVLVLIKLADILHNLLTIDALPLGRKAALMERSQRFVRLLPRVSANHPLFSDIYSSLGAEVVCELEKHRAKGAESSVLVRGSIQRLRRAAVAFRL